MSILKLHLIVLSYYYDAIVVMQAEGAPDMTALAGVTHPMEHSEELYDPLAAPDVDK